MSDKWVTTFDVEKCTGCCNCVLATLDEHVNNPHEGFSAGVELHGEKLLDISCVERGSYPVVDVSYVLRTCQHCVNPPCAKQAPDVVEVRQDGIVRIKPEKAKGRRDILDACPFDVVAWNNELEMPQVWTMDVHLLEQGWLESRASQACPTGALVTRKICTSELERMRNSGEYRSLNSDVPARTSVLYRNTKVLDSLCLSGRFVHTANGKQECLAGVRVSLIADPGGRVLAQAQTDDFGIFRLDVFASTEEEQAKIVIEFGEGQFVEYQTSMDESKFVGVIEAT